MIKTAAKIISEETHKWIEREDIVALARSVRKKEELEELTKIKSYGKWCALGAGDRLGFKPQIKYSSSSTGGAWAGTVDISDEEAMCIHAATIGLPKAALEIIDRVYIHRQPQHYAQAKMGIGRRKFYEIIEAALAVILSKIT